MEESLAARVISEPIKRNSKFAIQNFSQWKLVKNGQRKGSRILHRSKLNCKFAAQRYGRNLKETRRI